MAIIWENENDSSVIDNIPIGLYYYFIDKTMTYDMNYVGYVPTIESVTFNPFISKDDLMLVGNNFDTDKFGKPNNTIPKCYRIVNNPIIEKELHSMKVFPHRIEFPNDYEPKLYSYPFRYYLVTDYINPPLLIKPELISNNNNLVLKVITAPLSQSGKYNLFVYGYKGDSNGNLEGIVNNTSLMLPVASSVYSNFLATSSASFNKGIENSLLENDMSLRQGSEANELRKWSGITNNALGGVGDVISGNLGNLISRGVSGVYGYKESEMNQKHLQDSTRLKENVINSMASAKVSDMLSTPKALKTCGNDTLFNLINSRQKIDIIEYRPTEIYQDRIEEYFKRYGYSLNKYDYINFRSRTHFNFIKTHICNIVSETVPHTHINEIKEIFNSGITFWHVEKGIEIGDYSTHNREVIF